MTLSGIGISVTVSRWSRTLSRAWTPCSSFLYSPSLLRESRLELVEGVELARQLGEVVVGLGQLALLDGRDGDGDLRRPCRRTRRPTQLRREGLVDSPAVSPTIASSMPSIRSSEPTS